MGISCQAARGTCDVAHDRGAAIMSQTLKRAIALTGTVIGLGAFAGGCLNRPVQSSPPTLKTNFTDPISNTGVDKIDILFMIDNSASMGDKQKLLADAVPDMLNRLITPNCVDSSGVTQGVLTKGACPAGTSPEFAPVQDMHIGIVSSSLGGRGGQGLSGGNTATNDACNSSSDGTVVVANSTPQHDDDKGELLNRAGQDEHSLADLKPDNFLAWYPSGSASPDPAIKTAGQAVVIDTANPGTPADGTLIGDFQDMVVGVHERGCGYEAQLEGWYRFLIEPNPFSTITYNTPAGQIPSAQLSGVDSTIIAQRAAFLRPDSLVAVIVVTDENQEVADPHALSGGAWAFENEFFPTAPGGYGAPEGTKVCEQNPMDPGCTCCATITSASDQANQCANQADGGKSAVYYLPSAQDNSNIRFFHMKQRFGVDVGYPSSRYINGLTSQTVPDQNYQHSDCTNPLFAATLPTSSSAELCKLPTGSKRSPGGNLVYYAAITGVPHELLQAQPGSAECSTGTPAGDCPQKSMLEPADWTLILGQDPENYKFTGADFHMLESQVPRTPAIIAAAGAVNNFNVGPCLPGSAADNCDPINGREYDTDLHDGTGPGDLQYACTFKLDQPKDCTLAQYQGACDCMETDAGGPVWPNQTSSLCQKSGNNYGTTQVYGKAYPGIEELLVAKGLGAEGIVSSLCPIHTGATETSATDPLYGYRPAVNAIINRLKSALQVSCPPHKLDANSDGTVPGCLVLATFTSNAPASCAAAGAGFSDVDPAVLQEFQNNQHNQWVANHMPGGAASDPAIELTCAMQQILPTGGPFTAASNCSGASQDGWCYLENTVASGDAGAGCSYQILFANHGPPKNTVVNVTCVEQAGDGG